MTKEEIGREILRILGEDGRLTSSQIAERLAVDVQEVAETVAELEKKNVIIGYSAIFNESELPESKVKAVIEVKVQPEREGGFDRVAQRIARFPEVVNMYLMSGKYDLLLFVEGDSLRKVAGFVSRHLATLDGVLSTGTHFMLKTYKEDGVLMEETDSDERLAVSP